MKIENKYILFLLPLFLCSSLIAQKLAKPKYVLFYKSEYASLLDGHILSFDKRAYYLNENEGYIITESWIKPADSAKKLQLMNLNEIDYDKIGQTIKKAQEDSDKEFSYFNFTKSQYIMHLFDSENNYYFDVIDSTKNIEWSMKDSFSTINNLDVQFAKGIDQMENKFEAWFANEIPISLGPFATRGLPGLIVEVIITNTKNQSSKYSVKSIELSPDIFFDFSKYTFSNTKVPKIEYSKKTKVQLENLKLMNQKY